MKTIRISRSLTQSAAVVAVVPLIALASACSSQGNSSPSSTSASAPATTNVLPPIPISQGGAVNVKVGDHLNVITPGVTKVGTDNAKVLDVSQPYSDGSATFNGGAKVLEVGKAKLTVFGAEGDLLYVTEITATS